MPLQVGDQRKREATAQVAPLTMDRHGSFKRVNSTRRGLSAVSVPFGGCTEPSNVNAGCNASPVRYQCH